MNTTNASNGWRWIGVAIFSLILLVLWLMGLGPILSSSEAECCGVAPVVEQQPIPITPVAKSPINIAFKAEADKVTFAGEVPTEADKHSAINAAAAIFGSKNVIDKLTVWKDASLPGWWQSLSKVLAWVKNNKDFGLDQQGANVTLTGVVASDTIKTAKLTEIKGIIGSLITNNRLSVEQVPVATATPTPVSNGASSPCSNNINVVISFNTGSAELSTNGKKQVDQVIGCLTTQTEVAGHTDNIGNDAFNNKLSKDRANSVITYITATYPGKGSLLSAVGYGENKPIADNTTAEGRARNRRIEFTEK
jgi:OmpA-OmpF porin, OOP family